jgi:hypothetical protein
MLQRGNGRLGQASQGERRHGFSLPATGQCR